MKTKTLNTQTFVKLFLFSLLLLLTFYNLELYPVTWFDEGIHLLVAKKLALEGAYRFGPAVGPTVFYPVALAMRLFGYGLVTARLVMCGFLLAGLAALYAVSSRQLGNWKVATVAILLLASSIGADYFVLGRTVLGEVPAVFFLLCGLWIWYLAIDEVRHRHRLYMLAIAGILFGLAIITKNQFALFIPAWVLIWLMNQLYFRQAAQQDFILPLIFAALSIIIWFSLQWSTFVDGRLLMEHSLGDWKMAAQRGVISIHPKRILFAIQFLSSELCFSGWILPGIIYAAYLSLSRSKQGLKWATLTILAMTWFGWYILFSVAWPRYVLMALSISALAIARLTHDVTEGYQLPLKEITHQIRDGRLELKWLVRTTILLVLLILILRPLSAQIIKTLTYKDASPQQMSAYITANLPKDAVLETYEPEICFLSGHPCHFPIAEVLDAGVEYVYYGGLPPSERYDFRQYNAPYLLLGRESRNYHVYDQQIVERDFERLVVIGFYELYRLKTPDQ